MARYRDIDMRARLLPVSLEAQRVLGSFARAVYRLVGELDLSGLDAHYRSGLNGAPAHAPAMLLRAVLLAYAQGMVSSRAIERACRDNVLFIALTGDAERGHPRVCIGLRVALIKAQKQDELRVSWFRWFRSKQPARDDVSPWENHPAAHLTKKDSGCPRSARKDPAEHTRRMRARIDTEHGRRHYGQRFATVEPVFGNLRHNKRFSRFTLRGTTKVDGQWKLFALVQNIEKLANHRRMR